MANSGMNPVAAGVVGAAVGIAVGAAAVELADAKKRKAIGKKIGEVKVQGEKVKEKVEEFSTMVGGKVEDVKGVLETKDPKGQSP